MMCIFSFFLILERIINMQAKNDYEANLLNMLDRYFAFIFLTQVFARNNERLSPQKKGCKSLGSI